ncbi:hypothetical protein CL622_07335 [archaeon]|nr:hypothetical protein [archaeon]|tara:strand:- start:383 stop:571 length:189 start_codon:yes stop_codon:yes gene_type:complete
MPIAERTWFVNRVIKEVKKSYKDAQEQEAMPLTRAAHDNSATQRELAGLSRNEVPARLRRFT